MSKPLSEHLVDYTKALTATGNTEKHIRLARNRIDRIVESCGFKYYDDISASRIQSFLSDLRQSEELEDGSEKPGISVQTFNYYLGSIKAFCRWMVKDRRATSSPVSHLYILNVLTDRRYERRALRAAESTLRDHLYEERAAMPRLLVDLDAERGAAVMLEVARTLDDEAVELAIADALAGIDVEAEICIPFCRLSMGHCHLLRRSGSTRR